MFFIVGLGTCKMEVVAEDRAADDADDGAATSRISNLI